MIPAYHPSWHCLCPCRAGHYAHSTGQYAAAAAHFRAVLASDAAHLADSAALAAALAELHADRGPGGSRAAGELLEGRGLGGLDRVLELPVHDRWVGLGWVGGVGGCTGSQRCVGCPPCSRAAGA